MIDFARIAAEALASADRLVPAWLPGGHKNGKYWVCGNLQGEPGTSLKVTLDEGCWKDWSTDEKGGDLISLFAAINNIENGEAAKRLAEELKVDSSKPAPVRAKPAPAPSTIGQPPGNAPTPEMGDISMAWCYRDAAGAVLHWVARYDGPQGKDIKPWCWDTAAGKWVCKGWPGKRPLYGLDLLAQHPTKPVMIVEGEKCADAMRAVSGCVYVVVTWSGGAKAVGKADWSPLAGRKVLIWPDADEPGDAAASDIVQALRPHCPEIKRLNVGGQPKGWDCADAIAGGMDWAEIVAWAKPRARVVHPTAPEEKRPEPPQQPPPADEPEDHQEEERTDEAVASFGLWADLGLRTGKSGPYANLDNAERILRRWEPLRGRFWWDEFHQKILTNLGTQRGEPAREWCDVDDHRLQLRIQREIGIANMGADTVRGAVAVVAEEVRRCEPRDWMESLTWDGTDRVGMFFIDCLGVADTAYARAASRNFWISLAARIYQPGCKVDTMVILEGPQGSRKSTALAEIGGRWFAEVASEVGSQKFREDIQGKLLVEIAELDSLNKADVTRIKQSLTCQVDRFRPSYGKYAKDFPRRCVFAGTTNEPSYLKDSTGGRRFWPITCTDIDLQAVRQMRTQCFAEAVARFKRGEPWWEMPAEETTQQQEKRRQVDTWEGLVRDWLYGKGEVTVASVLADCLKIEPAHQGHSEQIRAAKAMKAAGWEQHFQWNGSKTIRTYKPKAG